MFINDDYILFLLLDSYMFLLLDRDNVFFSFITINKSLLSALFYMTCVNFYNVDKLTLDYRLLTIYSKSLTSAFVYKYDYNSLLLTFFCKQVVKNCLLTKLSISIT